MVRTPAPDTTNRQHHAQSAVGVALRRGRRFWIGVFILLVVSLAVYANALTNPFQFDDISVILNDPRIQEFQVGPLLTGNYWRHENTDRLYRPLVLLSYAVNWSVSHEPWTFRVLNLIVHAGVCLLFLELVWRVYGSFAAAWGAGLAFALHPLHTEPLNTIVGRADLLVTLFMLAAALVYWSDALPEPKRRPLRPLAAAVLLALALACKENAVTLIAVVALLDWWRVQRGDAPDLGRFLRHRMLRAYLPILAVTAVYLMLRVQFIGALTSRPDVIDHFDNPIAHPTAGLEEGDSACLARWATPLATFAKAIRLLVAPNRLCFDYSYAAVETVRRTSDPRMWTGLALLVAIGLICVMSYRRRRRVLLVVALGAVTYSVVANVLVIGTIFGERLLYLPSISYCMLIGLVAHFAYGSRRIGPGAAWNPMAIVAAVALPLMGLWYCDLTVNRNRDWSSPERLYDSAYRVNPRSCKVLAGMAANAMSRGSFSDAHSFCYRATHIAPEYWPAWRTGARAVVQMAEGRTDQQQKDYLYDKALQYYDQALRLGAAGDPGAMLGAADLYARRGNYDRAIGILEQLVVYAPLNAQAFNDLARLLVTAEPRELRDPQRALARIERAMKLRPEVANYVDTYVDVLLALGRRDEALVEIHKVLGSLPADSPGVTHFRTRLEQLEPQPAPEPDAAPDSPP